MALLESVGPINVLHSEIAFGFERTIAIMSSDVINAIKLGKNIFP